MLGLFPFLWSWSRTILTVIPTIVRFSHIGQTKNRFVGRSFHIHLFALLSGQLDTINLLTTSPTTWSCCRPLLCISLIFVKHFHSFKNMTDVANFVPVPFSCAIDIYDSNRTKGYSYRFVFSNKIDQDPFLTN